jgi:hypothetical protein
MVERFRGEKGREGGRGASIPALRTNQMPDPEETQDYDKLPKYLW